MAQATGPFPGSDKAGPLRLQLLMYYDFLIAGAGFAGLVMAERLATQLGKTCLVVEKRPHIGGNAYDMKDAAGVLIHKYGPHYFRTNSSRIIEYLSLFTEWQAVDYKALSYTHGKFWSFPINLKTFEQILGRTSTPEEFELWLEKNRVPIDNPKNSEEVIISKVGWDLYEMFFKGYTMKQWLRHPRDLDASVCGRIPVRTNRDDRYLNDNFQALPRNGYTSLFERMVAKSGDKIKILLETDYRNAIKDIKYGHLIYTGPIDAFYDYCYGPLPYRTLNFQNESFTASQLKKRAPIAGVKGFWQPQMQVNYPNDNAFTRIVEIKHATGQICENTTIVREYPENYRVGKEPYYPIPAPSAKRLYQKYRELAMAEKKVSFVGRLATYRYYNMDQVVGMALNEFEKIRKKTD